jgi:AraC-like DNA-binding protein
MTLIHLARSIFNKYPAEQFNDNPQFEMAGGFDSFISLLESAETADDITKLFENLFDDFSHSKLDKQKLKNRILTDRLIAHILEHYTDTGLYTESVADFAGLSPAYVGRIFKRATGMSIPDFINDVRLTEASRLLTETEDPVHKISETVGITNGNYFYTLFKKKYGLTPSEFRLQNRIKAL